MVKPITYSFALALTSLAACGPDVAPARTEALPPHARSALIPGVEPAPPPFVDFFQDDPGCYIACYKNTGYNGHSIEGFIRVHGSYDRGHVCSPAGAESEDISRPDSASSRLCGQIFPDACADKACWAGGDTYSSATYHGHRTF